MQRPRSGAARVHLSRFGQVEQGASETLCKLTRRVRHIFKLQSQRVNAAAIHVAMQRAREMQFDGYNPNAVSNSLADESG